MSKADKMFEELGYEKTENWVGNTLYVLPDTSMYCVWFDEELKVSGNNFPFGLSKEVKTVVHEKMKELGWLGNV